MDQDLVTVGDHLAVLRRRWLVLIVCSVLGLGAGLAFSQTQQRLYEADAKVLAVPGPSSVPEASLDAEQVATQAEVVLSDRIVAKVVDSVNFDAQGQDLVDATTVIPSDGTSVLIVTSQMPTGEQAAAVANAFAQSYLDYRAEQVTAAQDLMEQQLVELRGQITSIQKSLRGVPADAKIGARTTLAALTTRATDLEGQVFLASTPSDSSGGQPLQLAQPPEQPIQPRPVWDAGLGAFLGFIVGLLIAYATKGSGAERHRRTSPQPS
ncbi:Wzz/FepE/Etk N-terminal domain-containing protein [Nocardioides mesophilus]|uniref:Polysaccharide chain length determinant N-terminal domain-containing protein n=1 Tax=Nocardioides mesophilus TaxID=433659 RepID=A0A7G9REK4_9ACTN|nr:Wzz/FepE/Etk N-terminal domain-containing protein [Nocardioides mesophilus]QNN54029.1 hypothetical protein H9L09_06525 [Nocardioides mesophilus]